MLRLPDIPKGIRVFWKLFCSTLKRKEKPIKKMGSKHCGQPVLNDIFYVIGGHIIKPFTFLEFSVSSTPPFRFGVFSFLIPPPPLRPVNRFSIQLPLRISFKLENSDCLKLSLSGQGGRRDKKKRIAAGEIQARD